MKPGERGPAETQHSLPGAWPQCAGHWGPKRGGAEAPPRGAGRRSATPSVSHNPARRQDSGSAVTHQRSRISGHVSAVTHQRSRISGHVLAVTHQRSRISGHCLSRASDRAGWLGQEGHRLRLAPVENLDNIRVEAAARWRDAAPRGGATRQRGANFAQRRRPGGPCGKRCAARHHDPLCLSQPGQLHWQGLAVAPRLSC